ncbi:hypothetical protein D3C87_1449940 [compost metagenome]
MDRGAGADRGHARPPPRGAAAPRAGHRAAPDGAPAGPAPAASCRQRCFRDGWGCQGRRCVRPGCLRAQRWQQNFAESRGSPPLARRKDPFPPQTRTPARWPAPARPATAGPSGVPALYRGGGQHRGPAWRLDAQRQLGRRHPRRAGQAGPRRGSLPASAAPLQPARQHAARHAVAEPLGLSGRLSGAEQQRALHGDRG